jgi:hypothetical protein
MKKILVLASLLIFAAACATEPSGNKDMTTNANKGSEMKSSAAPSEADIIAKEKAAWDAFRKKDADAFGKMMTADYIEVLDSGVMDKATSIAGMKDFEISDVTFADWRLMTIDKDAVIITYSVTVKGSYKGQAVPAGPYREASAYVNRNGEWLAIYYQETLSRTAPPPPTPAASTAPKSAASPMAKPADAGPDAAANEKLVWDALKSKNYDGFASYLASDAVEIEADGVYDKSGSVKGVSGFDFSKARLSDWKTVKLDNDASLVTYTVMIPGMKPEMEYHSTIWINRNGKWQAYFHMGTPAAADANAKPEMKKM